MSLAAADGVRVELPASNALRVENWRGSVKIEVWSESDVSVTAMIDGATPKSSPVIIERTAQLLKIGVARQKPGTPPERVDLLVRLPERSRAEVVTSSGEVDVRGVPAELRARTIKGDIRAEVSANSNASVAAETVSGQIDSTLTATTPAVSARIFHTTLGKGRNLLSLRSERGRITLVSTDSQIETASSAPSPASVSLPQQDSQPATEETRKPPTLVGADRGTGAGTPATPLSTPEEIDEGDIVRVDTELVTVNMSVIDRGTNRGLVGLRQDDFKVYEDGVPQQIVNFDSASAPFNLVLLIDLSGSTQDVVKLIREAALHFVNAARAGDRISVITFSAAPVIVSPLTNDREALRQRINAIEKPQGSTRLYDALGFAIDEVLKDSKNSRRNAIVLMSDGLDSQLPNVTGDGSQLDYRELLGRVREFDGVLYTLWLDTETEYSSLSELDVQPETFDLAHDRMKELADAGGGIFYEVEALEDLAGAYERVVADLGTVYSIGYRPANKQRDGKWRAIRVAVARPNAVARGKRGYYAN
ncbi:MAG TPA: VWA domain-containing protein [Pyrinomonadaceae bacterium]|nr:VWA domain-containing protein [Pyrinomonadaceae bacterium]